jgi:serpin B
MPDSASVPHLSSLLVQLAHGQNQHAWDTLIRDWGGEVFRICCHILGRNGFAEDACQDTLLHVRSQAKKFQPLAPEADLHARRWLLRVACNCSLKTLRRERRMKAREVPAQYTEASDPADQCEQAELRGMLRVQLAALSEKERLAIVLRYAADLSYQDIAVEIGSSEGHARVLVHRGVERLRERLRAVGALLALAFLLDGGEAHAAEISAALRQRLSAGDHLKLKSGGRLMWPISAASIIVIAALTLPAMLPDASMSRQERPTSVHSDSGSLHAEGDNVPPIDGDHEADGENSAAAVVAANSAFACELYMKLAEKPGNLFFCPYSISSALAMTAAGADGQTLAQMRAVLHAPFPDDAWHGAFGRLTLQMNEHDPAVRFTVANSLWGQKGHRFLDSFVSMLKMNYQAGMSEVDFRESPGQSSGVINAWVGERTNQLIPKLLSPTDIKPDTKLFLVNAVHFKGDWLHPFDPKDTREREFHLSAHKTIRVPTMSQMESFGLIKEKGYDAVQLPYMSKEFSMVVLIPHETEGLAAVEQQLSATKLAELQSECGEPKIMLQLPKWSMRWRSEPRQLPGQLRSLGMSDAFGTAADFSKTDGSKELFIAEVVHEAVINVDEVGSEAAAATAVREETKSLPEMISVDKPYLFFICHKPSNSIVFMGRVTDPSQ